MKTISMVLIILLASLTSIAQDITGQWNGILKFQGIQLRLVFNVAKNNSGYSATMDSPDQGAIGIPVTNTTIDNAKIQFEIANAGIEYNGELKDTTIVGTFKQGGQELPLNLTRATIQKEALKRPQEPAKPYSYYSEEVIFPNSKANLSLAGTLTLPKREGLFPVVILISGSGPQNRDEEILGHKPFLVIADHLTKNGIGVLRYDDRGIGQSTGDFKTGTSADFATDVESAIAYLKTRKEVNQKGIGLVGHSEGGLIAPMVAARSKDVSFIVLLAGTGIPGDQLLLLQQELIAKAEGVSASAIEKTKQSNARVFDRIIRSNNDQQLKAALTSLINEDLQNDTSTVLPQGMTKDEFVALQVQQISTPWMQYFLKYNPAPALAKVKCPVLAVNGEKDLQVPAKENLSAIKNALTKAGNKKVTTLAFPNLNHLFQESKTGAPSEYATIEQTFSPLVLDEITKWIKAQTKVGAMQ